MGFSPVLHCSAGLFSRVHLSRSCLRAALLFETLAVSFSFCSLYASLDGWNAWKRCAVDAGNVFTALLPVTTGDAVPTADACCSSAAVGASQARATAAGRPVAPRTVQRANAGNGEALGVLRACSVSLSLSFAAVLPTRRYSLRAAAVEVGVPMAAVAAHSELVAFSRCCAATCCVTPIILPGHYRVACRL